MDGSSQLRTAPHEWIADGRRDVGTDDAGDAITWRWFLERLPDGIVLQTIQGWNNGDLVTLQTEVPGACQASACVAIDRLLADRAAKASRKVMRRV
jgi:hypothetical protein